MKSVFVLGASFVAAVQDDAYQSWTNVVETLHKEDECTSHDSSCSVTLLQMRSNVIKRDAVWGYDEDMAPGCGGSSQSPVDLPAAGDVGNNGDTLEVSYTAVDASNVKIKNNGQGFVVKASYGELALPDGVYEAKQVNIHCPSDHTIEGKHLPCEMHIVHQRRSAEGTDGLAIVAIMLQQAKTLGLNADTGRELAFFRRLGLGNRLGLPNPGQAKPIANIPLDLNTAFRRQLQGGYYHYRGSMLTPPCSETVHWYVMKQPAAIAEEMFENFMILFPEPGKNRPVQPLNGRAIVMDEESVDDSEFSGAVEPHWTYGEQGKWPLNFPACGGTAQSPIDLNGIPSSKTGAHLNQHTKYHQSKGAGLEIKNNGHSLQIDCKNDIGYLALYDGKYYAQQFHFHFPSEHSVDGKLAAGEMHIVHQKEGSTGTNDLAVVSILIDDIADVGAGPLEGFDGGLEIAFFRDIGLGAQLPRLGKSKPIPVDNIDVASSFATQLSGPFWHYRGSLTTPPCSETVHWYVAQKRAEISHKMITEFKKLYPDPANNRDIQPRGARRVEMDMALPDEFNQQ